MSQLLIHVIHSIPDGVALIDTVLHHYPIRNIRSCKLYKRGLNNTYLVETEQERYSSLQVNEVHNLDFTRQI